MGNKAPHEYFGIVFNQCETANPVYGNFTDKEKLLENLSVNCIPHNIVEMNFTHYEDFLRERRKLMAMKIKEFYYSL